MRLISKGKVGVLNLMKKPLIPSRVMFNFGHSSKNNNSSSSGSNSNDFDFKNSDHRLTNVSALDGRYASAVYPLREYFS